MACLLLMLLALSAISTLCPAWNVSIDCGASGSYNDSNSIKWIGDASFVQNGHSQEVEHTDKPLRSMRVFSSGKINCYSINATKGEHLLLRATFYYGNYDNKFLPPTFGILFDANFWTLVETEIDQEVSHESVYFAKRNVISVCLVQTKPDQLPFISALEVRSLSIDMYAALANKNVALFLQKRLALGTSSTVRYPDDKYDRIWSPSKDGGDFASITRKETSIVINTNDYPPEAVLLGAVTPLNPPPVIQLAFPQLPEDEVPIYLNMYFAEIDKEIEASTHQKRSFVVFKDNLLLISEPVVPRYDIVTELQFSNITASKKTTFLLVPTNDSVFAPIINALEIFVVGGQLTDGTNGKDVDGLAALQRGFSVLQEWQGDPCLPVNYKWDWLNCSTDISPRVVALHLNSYGLSGPLPDFSSMDALQYIDLQNNNLNGTIPDFLGFLPNLKELNLADNNFIGFIPHSLFNGHIILRLIGNPNLCHDAAGSCKDLVKIPSSCRNKRYTLQKTFGALTSILIAFIVLS